MIVKKFQAPTETEAVLAAKQELGSNAVVLNVKTLKQQGIFRLFKKDVVEITAALEEKEFAREINEKRPKIDVVADEKVDIIPETQVLEEKLDNLHKLLKTQINKEVSLNEVKDMVTKEANEGKEEKETSSNEKFLKLIYNKMIDAEVDEKYANAIIGEIESSLKKESNIDSILSGVYQKIILKLGEPKPITLGDEQKVVFFVGPTGVGKTTTIAKIASKFKLSNHKKVALITADTYRIAAVEQLNTYANILDVPVKVVYTAKEMCDAVDEFKDYDIILIDTAGRSHKNIQQKDELMELYNAIKDKEVDIETFLVLSVTTKYKDLKNISDSYKDMGDYRLLFTKLDETTSLGNILNLKLFTGAPVSYTTSGQNVPDDIETINVQGLAKQLLGGNE